MKRLTLQWNAVRDDGGQALTEFVIVIPIMLLFFFAMLQNFADFQASQLGNYAAFMAARVYSVDDAVDSGGSQQKALRAASWAMAPVASPVAGEFGMGMTGSTGLLGGLAGSLGALNGAMGQLAVAKLATGYFFAENFRFGSLLGGSVTNSTGGSPKQVNTTIVYPQPVFIPGLAGMWDLVSGDKIYYSLKSLHQGLGGIPGSFLPIMENYNQAQQMLQQLSQFDSNIPRLLDLPQFILPYVTINAKCSLGYETWHQFNGGPRLHAGAGDSDGSGTSNSGAQQQQALQQASQDQQTYKDDSTNAASACQALCSANNDLATAHARDDPVINDPNAKQSDKDNASQDLQNYEAAQQSAAANNASAQSALSSAQTAIQTDTGQSLPSQPCACH